MTPGRRIVLLAAAVAVQLLGFEAAASAQPNPVLPFWAQPFPTGYTRDEQGLYPVGHRCRMWRRILTRHGPRTVMADRCRPVLHARD